jgi:hypothetical protein
MNDLATRWTSRKFWTMVSCVFLFTMLFIVGKIDQAGYIGLILPTIGSYFASNVSVQIWGKQ